jgi:putative polyhydroxyalkanoate system protein
VSHLHIERHHDLDPQRARERLDQAVRHLAQSLEVAWQWQDGRLLLQRPGASGTVQVAPDRIILDLRLGLFLSPFKGRIEEAITQALDAELGPPPAGGTGLAG